MHFRGPCKCVQSTRCIRARRAHAVVVKHFERTAPALLAAIGCFALSVGTLVYLTDRDPAQSVLFPTIAVLGTGPVFGTLGPWLPSFVHPFAFSLFTAASLHRPASPAYGGVRHGGR